MLLITNINICVINNQSPQTYVVSVVGSWYSQTPWSLWPGPGPPRPRPGPKGLICQEEVHVGGGGGRRWGEEVGGAGINMSLMLTDSGCNGY